MIAIPALDLRSGACVQLVGGSYEREVLRIADPVAVARRWGECGFQRLHLVDLDAATRRGSNACLVRSILEARIPREIHVGGGIATEETIRDLLTRGATNVVIGSRAMEDGSWLAKVAEDFPGRTIVAADVRGRRVLTHGWVRELAVDISDALVALDGLSLAGVLVTAVHREGQLRGPDIDLMRQVVQGTGTPIYAAGGITTHGDLLALQRCGVHAAVVGTALYTGALDASAVAEEFTQ
jgi:phosphoribosylformimino-5-aminoimidazole carboxamide ribotide isomerase